jgi:hypothetical protein
VTVTAPSGLEISDNGTNWYATLTETETSGTLASTTIDVRISASASAGSISSNVSNASAGATTEDVAVTGTVNGVPTLVASPGSLTLGTVTTGTAGSTYSYTLSGANLTTNVTVTAPTGVQISNNGTTWNTTLTEDETSGTLSSTTIYVRISATATAGAISSNVTNASAGATTEDVAVTGTVNGIPTITVSPGSLALGTVTAGTAGSTYSYTLSGLNLTSNVTVTAPTGIEISDDGTTWHTTLTEDEASGTLGSTTIYVRISASASAGGISADVTNASAGATTQNVSVSGTVTAAVPTVTVTPSSLALGTTQTGISGTPQAYTVSGANLTGAITITAPTGVELSSNGGTTWSETVLLSPTGGVVASKTIEARISASATAGTINAKITNSSIGATTQNVSVSGTVTAIGTPKITPSTNTLSLGATTSGKSGAPVNFTISGTGLNAALTLTAPQGVELSSNHGTTWQTILTLPESDGVLVSTVIETRIRATAQVGAVQGTIACTSTGASTRLVAVIGRVSPPAPYNLVRMASLDLRSTEAGEPGTIETDAISSEAVLTDRSRLSAAAVDRLLATDSLRVTHGRMKRRPVTLAVPKPIKMRQAGPLEAARRLSLRRS